MITVNIHEAKTNLSKLIRMAVDGHPFVIAKAGKPLVTVRAVETPAEQPSRRIGFMAGRGAYPEDFDTMHQEEIERLFYDGPIFPPVMEEEAGDRS